MDFEGYSTASGSEKSRRASALRSATISTLEAHGKSEQAERLKLEGEPGYPDEEDTYYLFQANRVTFDIKQQGVPYVPHYGHGPIQATLQCGRVYDGAGHGSMHYNLEQLYPSTLRYWRMVAFALWASRLVCSMRRSATFHGIVR